LSAPKTISKPEDFYAVWADHRTYAPAVLKPKYVRQFNDQFWIPARCAPNLSVLEVGCGTGLFLTYLMDKGVTDLTGVDPEPRVLDHMPPAIRGRVRIATIDAFLDGDGGRTYDRIALFDVFEHFSPYEGVALLERLDQVLAPGGQIVIRVPNASSPLGLRHQYGDLTHKAAYTPDSLAQAAAAAGLELETCLPVRRGKTLARLLRRGTEAVLKAVLGGGPDIWTAIFVGVLRRPD